MSSDMNASSADPPLSPLNKTSSTAEELSKMESLAASVHPREGKDKKPEPCACWCSGWAEVYKIFA